jgi:hypothetical protein
VGHVLEARDREVRFTNPFFGDALNPVGAYLSMTPHRISDSIWTAYGSLLVGAGPHMFLFGQPKSQLKVPLIENPDSRQTEREGLWEYVARENGPLEQFHPQMLLQCLLWGMDQSSSTSIQADFPLRVIH